jgi:hypothetical protein
MQDELVDDAGLPDPSGQKLGLHVLRHLRDKHVSVRSSKRLSARRAVRHIYLI